MHPCGMHANGVPARFAAESTRSTSAWCVLPPTTTNMHTHRHTNMHLHRLEAVGFAHSTHLHCMLSILRAAVSCGSAIATAVARSARRWLQAAAAAATMQWARGRWRPSCTRQQPHQPATGGRRATWRCSSCCVRFQWWACQGGATGGPRPALLEDR